MTRKILTVFFLRLGVGVKNTCASVCRPSLKTSVAKICIGFLKIMI